MEIYSDRDVCKDSGSGVDCIFVIRQELCRALRFPERIFSCVGINIRDLMGLVEQYGDIFRCRYMFVRPLGIVRSSVELQEISQIP